jgi:hypothetical protein
VPEVLAPALAKLEAEIGQVLDEHRDKLVHRIATAFVEIGNAPRGTASLTSTRRSSVRSAGPD